MFWRCPGFARGAERCVWYVARSKQEGPTVIIDREANSFLCLQTMTVAGCSEASVTFVGQYFFVGILRTSKTFLPYIILCLRNLQASQYLRICCEQVHYFRHRIKYLHCPKCLLSMNVLPAHPASSRFGVVRSTKYFRLDHEAVVSTPLNMAKIIRTQRNLFDMAISPVLFLCQSG